MQKRLLVLLSALPFMLLGMTDLRAQQETGSAARRVIIFVWDGLRADDLTPEITPNYFALARSGVVFADHHAVYPTFTMMNSASIATGAAGPPWIDLEISVALSEVSIDGGLCIIDRLVIAVVNDRARHPAKD